MLTSSLRRSIPFCIFVMCQIKNATALQSPNSSALSIETTRNAENEHLHPSGRRWKRRRKQQMFLPSPHKNVSPSGEAALVKQLGYVPPNICCVSARTSSDSACNEKSKETTVNGDIDTTSHCIGRPVAIRSYPLLIQKLGPDVADGDRYSNIYINCNVTPFPTLYWLCDSHISRAISELERHGYLGIFQTRLENNPSQAKEWLECHKQYALERWDLLSNQDRKWLLHRDAASYEKECRTMESMRDMIHNSGVAGTDYKGQNQKLDATNGPSSLFVPSVKCLHSHYAHYRSQLCAEPGKNVGSGLNVIGVWTHELLIEKFPDMIL